METLPGTTDKTVPRFYADAWCLDFANTVEPRDGQGGHDFVPDYEALLRWSESASLLSPSGGRRLRRAAAEDPRRAADAHGAAIALREATYRTFAAVAAGRTPRGADVATIHDTYLDALRHARPRVGADGLDWAWPAGELPLPGWRVAFDAVELLRSDRLDRVKSCQPSCGWLFLDTSKNHSRRWCSMRECGFEEKARLQAERRARRRTAGGGSA
jgi:predicted RNA-binding Zn ribbon-like protein